METLTLLELNSLVRMTIEQTLNQEYWVEAELSECRESRGHCYMELIQYDDSSLSPYTSHLSPQRTPVARAQAKCWRTQWMALQPYFECATGQQLHAGLKVRLKVYAQFHEAYGFSWIVTDIDPTFTMGDQARRRQEIVSQLKAEGVFDLQKELPLPLFCLNIAVISSATAAGYGDFVNQLADSPFAFTTQLFPATMQGEQVEQSVIEALEKIYKAPPSGGTGTFDCVVIIRGGGATADLSGFDTLALAENVAQFPLPIITGIGHDRDESILDMVSHTRVKTPTAAAQFLISHAEQTMRRIENCEERILRYAPIRMENERLRLVRLSERIPPLFSLFRTRQEARLDALYSQMLHGAQQKLSTVGYQLSTIESRLAPITSHFLDIHRHRLQLLEQRAKSLDPVLLLSRGYSITLLNGHALRSPSDVRSGDVIETRLEKGILHSVVNK